jgi:putative tryptophan/tyrosine transport system substrate-binding protein
MKRREFVTLLGGAAAMPLVTYAQTVKRVGVLITANPEPFWTLFQEGMRDLGYHDGGNVRFEIRSADGRADLLPSLAAELAHLKVDVIVAHQTPALAAASKIARDIPIVMAGVGDPVGQGFVTTLARPGGNITGVSLTTAELGPKALEIIKEIIPSARRVAVLANAPDPFSASFVEHLRPAGRDLRLDLVVTMVRAADELVPAFEAMTKAGTDAVIVQPSLPRPYVAELAVRHRIPAVSPTPAFAAEGGLASYAANPSEIYRKSALYVDKILKGSNPADLPVEQPITFMLAVNLKTAKALNLIVPATLLARADEVIE